MLLYYLLFSPCCYVWKIAVWPRRRAKSVEPFRLPPTLPPVSASATQPLRLFLADLLRNLNVPTELEFIQISSYKDETKSTGEIDFVQGLTTDMEGRDVLVVEDIVDSGLTLRYLRELLLTKQPASLKFCVLLDKTGSRTEDVEVDYTGFGIPNEFVIGYGLDYAGQYRGLRYIATLES